MELTDGHAALKPCLYGEHLFIPIGDGQKREDAVRTTIGTTAFCQKCSNTVFVVVVSQSKITAPPTITS